MADTMSSYFVSGVISFRFIQIVRTSFAALLGANLSALANSMLI